ncbi:MAG TPA: tetratricopeptide repeat protein [Candidatus Dormibacteraeota bacterium]|nr:tetratricopeptide repeat protein [Candidatus Dormibacteraeota bacterium]
MLDRRYRGRRKGVRIREGSVRQARLEAGLSLAEVAGNLVTRTAIHLIEHDRVKPSMETLQHIARRTRKPLDYFLVPQETGSVPAPQNELVTLEQLSNSRDFAAVVEKGTALLRRRWDTGSLATIHYLVGSAHCRSVRPDEALEHLRKAHELFEELGDAWMVVDTLDWEAAAYGLKEDPHAIDMALDALERCRRLDPIPSQTEARILGHIAAMHVVAESWPQAIRYYESAVEAAGAVKDLLQQAKMHHGLGAAYQRMQQPVRARQHFERALALYAIESDLSAVYRLENDLGHLLLQEGHLDAAENHFVKALRGSDELRLDRRGRGFILVNFGELHLRRGDLEASAGYLGQALESAASTGEQIVLADAHALLGEVDEARGDSAAADREFEIALATLERLGMPDRLRDCHMKFAEVLDARGEQSRAAGHWRLAAQIGKLALAGAQPQEREGSAAG